MSPKSLNDLKIALRQNRWLAEVLERFEEIGLPDGWLVAGSIAQTIWNLGCKQTAEFGIKDVDPYISINKTYRSKLKSLTKDASVIYFAVFQ